MSTLKDKVVALERTARLQAGALVPLLPARPSLRRLPALKPRARDLPFGQQVQGWQLDSFIAPAAFPRSAKRVKLEETRPQDRDERLLNVYERQVLSSQAHVDIGDLEELGRQPQMYLALHRFRPRKPRKGKGLTLLFSHANGFHKETWDPTIAELLSCPGAGTLPIEEIWSLDAYNQGDSGLLNAEVLGDTHTWADNGRDILNFIISYLPSLSSPTASALPAELLSRPAPASLLALDTVAQPAGPASPPSRTFNDRLIVGIGHSAGATALAFAATAVPSLFSSVILCDPVVPASEVSWHALAKGALNRRETWGSREEAQEAFLKRDFYKVWSAAALDNFCEHGLKEIEDGVALKCKPVNEALPFADPMAVDGRRACVRLASLPPELPVHFIHADVGKSILPEKDLDHIAESAPHTTRARLAGSGHLLVQEDPKGTAEEIAKFLQQHYPAN